MRVAAVYAAQEERGEDNEDDRHDDRVPVSAYDGEGSRGRARRRRRGARRCAVQTRATRLALGQSSSNHPLPFYCLTLPHWASPDRVSTPILQKTGMK